MRVEKSTPTNTIVISDSAAADLLASKPRHRAESDQYKIRKLRAAMAKRIGIPYRQFQQIIRADMRRMDKWRNEPIDTRGELVLHSVELFKRATEEKGTNPEQNLATLLGDFFQSKE